MISKLTIAVIALLTSGALATSPARAADPKTVPATKPVIKPSRPGVPVVQPMPATTVSAQQRSILHRADLAASPALTGGALSTFDFQFHNGDHKLRVLQLLQSGGRASVAFADQDSNDPFAFSATWWQANYQLVTLSAVGAGEFEIALPQAPFAHVPLLAGFAFERRSGTDANLRSIGVRLTPDRKRVRVMLVDDQGVDLRGFERAVGAGFAYSVDPFGLIGSGIALGVGASGVVDAINAHNRAAFPEFNAQRQRNFVATVQIVWVPSGAVLGRHSVSGGDRHIESGYKPVNEKVALEGFYFHFGNSDHHLQGIGVELKEQRYPEAIRFQDNNRDDPIQWSVDYAALK